MAMASALNPNPSALSDPAKTWPYPFPEPRIQGETEYDRFLSFLLSIVIGGALAVGWLALAYWSMKGFSARVPAPVTFLEVYGGGGGSADGDPNETIKVDLENAEASSQFSNAEIQAADFEEPTPAMANAALLDVAKNAVEVAADLAPTMEQGAMEATGRRSRKEGTGGVPLGDGPGDGGVADHMRWSVLYTAGQTIDEYARQLDFMEVELGVLKDNAIHYVSGFTLPQPRIRVSSSGGSERRLYFLWQGEARKKADVELLKKAGLDVGNGQVFQFYSEKITNLLRQKEFQFKGLQPTEIRRTVFKVTGSSGSYDVEVASQTPLRGGS